MQGFKSTEFWNTFCDYISNIELVKENCKRKKPPLNLILNIQTNLSYIRKKKKEGKAD